MTLRDDMVFTPDIGPQRKPAAPVRAREERKLAGAKKRKGVLSKLRAARALKKRRVRKRRARSGGRMIRAARGGGAALARGAAGAGGRAALGNPIGLIVAGLIVAGVVTLRLVSGKPLEGTGAMLNRMILGDMDDEARAKMAVRQRFQGDSDLTRIVGQEKRTNVQMTSIANDMFKLETQQQKGASLLREEFPTNNVLDMLILRARDKFVELWGSEGGAMKAQEVADRIGSRYTGKKAASGGR